MENKYIDTILSDKGLIKSLLSAKISELQAELEKYKAALNEIENDNNKMNNNTESEGTTITQLENGYILEWTWIKKIKFILKENNNSPLTAKDITSRIIKYEPKQIYKTVYSVVSGQLSNKIRAGKEFDRKLNELDEFEYWLK